MRKISQLLVFAVYLALPTKQALALDFTVNDGIPLITISDGASIKTRYRITALGPTGQFSFANGINDQGIVVGGTYRKGTSPNSYRTFVFQNNRLHFLKNFRHIRFAVRSQIINNSGRVVGETVVNGIKTPAVYTAATDKIQILPKPDRAVKETILIDINDFGVIFGRFEGIDNQDNNLYFIFDKGKFTDLLSLDGDSLVAEAINNKGAVVGEWFNKKFGAFDHGFLDEQGVLKDLTPFEVFGYSDLFGQAFDINQRGQIVGRVDGFKDFGFKTYKHAFIYDKGRYTLFQVAEKGKTEGGAIDFAAINNRGDITGSYFDGFRSRSIFYRNGIAVELKSLIPKGSGWAGLFPIDINNLGQIAGTGFLNGQLRAFLLTPISAAVPQ